MKEGTPKERAMLIANSYSERVFGNRGFLTREQMDDLERGIKTKRGYENYKKVIDYEYHIRIMIPFLESIELELSEIISFANGLCMTDFTAFKFINLLNSLCHEYKEPLRDKVLANINENSFFTGRLEADPEAPFLTFNKTESINEVFDSVKDKLQSTMTDLKTMITAIRDFMKNEKLDIDTYKIFLKEREEKWKEDPSIVPMYGFKHLENDDITQDLIEYMKQFQIFPDYREITIDKELYNSYIRSLGGFDYEGPE